jgi:hypothetical protein
MASEALSPSSSHGELKRRLATLVGSDPSRYSTKTGTERHKRLSAAEIGGICEQLGLDFLDCSVQEKRDAIMLKIGRDHRTGKQYWDSGDLHALVRELEGPHVA